jgi:hypothetical protein
MLEATAANSLTGTAKPDAAQQGDRWVPRSMRNAWCSQQRQGFSGDATGYSMTSMPESDL